MYTNTQGNWAYVNVRTSAVLTTSYVAGTVIGLNNDVLGTVSPNDINCNHFNQLILECNLTKESLTSVEVKIEYSEDNSVWYQETNKAVLGGATTLTPGEYTIVCSGLDAAANFLIEIPIKYRYIRVSSKGTGTVTSCVFGIKAKLGTV